MHGVHTARRYGFADRLRGVVIALMALDHVSRHVYFAWTLPGAERLGAGPAAHVVMRWLGYLCAPGFFLLAGAMAWLACRRRSATAAWRHLALRGLWLVALQVLWVNAAWSGFARWRPDHFGVLGCIGLSLALLALMTPLCAGFQRLRRYTAQRVAAARLPGGPRVSR
jgi:uncharacterized membrane protein